VSYITETDC